jgi:hypothetical protein
MSPHDDVLVHIVRYFSIFNNIQSDLNCSFGISIYIYKLALYHLLIIYTDPNCMGRSDILVAPQAGRIVATYFCVPETQ